MECWLLAWFPTLSLGKHELLIDLRDKGANAVKATMYHQEFQLVVPSCYEDYHLKLVGAYKHLGTWIQSGAGVSKDLAVKCAVAHDLVTKYRAPIFGNQKVPLEKKRQLIEMMVLSTVTFNAAVWCPQNKRQAEQIEASFLRLNTRVYVLHFGHQSVKWSRVRILNEYHDVTLRRARLRYLLQLVHVGQPHTWALLQMDSQWKQQLDDDLDWLHEYCPEDEVPRPIQSCWGDLMALLWR